jgi:hypothetical protein
LLEPFGDRTFNDAFAHFGHNQFCGHVLFLKNSDER